MLLARRQKAVSGGRLCYLGSVRHGLGYPLLFILGVALAPGCDPGQKMGTVERPSTDRAPKASPPKAHDARRASSKPAPERNSPPEKKAPAVDIGIFPDLDASIETGCPPWLEKSGPRQVIVAEDSGSRFYAWEGIPLCEARAAPKPTDPRPILLPKLEAEHGDSDPYPRALDILRGAKKAVANAAEYRNSYRKLDYPDGDVPRTEGVCTDVIIRALRNDGLDLQEEVQRDIKRRPSAYPMVKRADPYIDHRRVKTLLPYFQDRFASLPTDHDDSASPYFPGDIVFMNTYGDAAPDHLGIVSDRVGTSGNPLIINNWTDGHRTAEMDLLGRIPVTHRFRIARAVSVPKGERSLDGVLLRARLSVPAKTKQALLVTVPTWNSTGGRLQRYERLAQEWRPVGRSFAVRIGAAGLAQGRGLSEGPTPRVKREGDKRAPSGVFSLATAFARTKQAPYSGTWSYRAVGKGDYWVDDPQAKEYNTWQELSPGKSPPWSAEHLAMYSLGLVVNHNTEDIEKGAGSAIFIHPWRSPNSPTVGCTSLDKKNLLTILSWLDPKAEPVLVQTAGFVFSEPL